MYNTGSATSQFGTTANVNPLPTPLLTAFVTSSTHIVHPLRRRCLATHDLKTTSSQQLTVPPTGDKPANVESQTPTNPRKDAGHVVTTSTVRSMSPRLMGLRSRSLRSNKGIGWSNAGLGRLNESKKEPGMSFFIRSFFFLFSLPCSGVFSSFFSCIY
jgi:hypothetical protein